MKSDIDRRFSIISNELLIQKKFSHAFLGPWVGYTLVKFFSHAFLGPWVDYL